MSFYKTKKAASWEADRFSVLVFYVDSYTEAAEAGKLKVYSDSGHPGESIVYPDNKIEPTCISDIGEPMFQSPLWEMKRLLDQQVAKERFWLITEDDLGTVTKQIEHIVTK